MLYLQPRICKSFSCCDSKTSDSHNKYYNSHKQIRPLPSLWCDISVLYWKLLNFLFRKMYKIINVYLWKFTFQLVWPDFLVYKGQRRLSNVVLPCNVLKLRLYSTINIRDGLLIPQILFICGPREQVQILPPLFFLSFR